MGWDVLDGLGWVEMDWNELRGWDMFGGGRYGVCRDGLKLTVWCSDGYNGLEPWILC
jgi:hypothetical protein